MTRFSDTCIQEFGRPEPLLTHEIGGDLKWVIKNEQAMEFVRPVFERAVQRMRDMKNTNDKKEVVTWLTLQMGALGCDETYISGLTPSNISFVVRHMK